MRAPTKSPATKADLRDLPENLVGELLAGELFVSPRPAARHAVISSSLGGELYGAFQTGRSGPGGWWIIDEPELHLSDDVLVPDLAGWRRSRLPEIPDEPAFTLPPDWVCEILSPSTARLDLERKLPRYATAGIGHAWIIHPDLEVLEIFRLDAGRWVLAGAYSGAQTVNAEPFEAFALELGRLWGSRQMT